MKIINVETCTEESWINAFNQIAETKNEDVQFELKCTIEDITMPENVNNKSKNTVHSPIIYLLRLVSVKKDDGVRFKLLLRLGCNLTVKEYTEINNIVKSKIEEYDNGIELPAEIELSFNKFEINVELSRLGWVKAFMSFQPKMIYQTRWTLNFNSVNFKVTAEDSDDVCNFRFYLPLRKYLKEKKKNVKITSHFSTDFQQRFNAFFAVDGEIETPIFETASDILPVMTIEKSMQNSIFDLCVETYNRSVAFEKALKYNANQIDAFISLYNRIIVNFNEKNYRLFLAEAKEIAEDYESKKREIKNQHDESDLLKQNALRTLEREYEKQKNEQWDNKIGPLFEKWINFGVKDNCGKLSQLIFAFLLRQYVPDFEEPLFYKHNINDYFLRQLIADSKSYAEGLWQLIENAHEHSQGEVAFFGMRLHKARTDTTVGEIAKTAQTRSNLADSFLPGSYKGDSIFNSRNQLSKMKYQDFLEIYVLDDAVDTQSGDCKGLLDILKKHQKEDQKDILITPETIVGIFCLSEEDYNGNEGRKNFYIKHYGMRWLKHHVDKHDGVFMVYSPVNDVKSIDGWFYHNKISKEKVKKDWITSQAKSEHRIPNAELEEFVCELPKNLFFTEYDILLPISHGKQEKETIYSADTHNDDYFEKSVNLISEKAFEFNVNKLIHNLISKQESTKMDCINALAKQFVDSLESFDHANSGKSDSNILFKLVWGESDNDNSYYDVEVFAKALFLLAYDNAKNEKLQLRICIDFGKRDSARDLISEFIRLYSIFYLKSNENEYMKNVQIALCSEKKDVDGKCLTEINFILAGGTLSSAYDIANKFVYYNATSSLDFVPLLSYLTASNKKTSGSNSSGNKSSENVGIYPFELIAGLNEGMSCWFTDYMKKRLTTKIRPYSQEEKVPFDSYGCKISNVRVRLGSKIHIDNFYEAELLFHNIGNIRRFAYLIAMDIFALKDESKTEENDIIYILGYENYSAPVVQEVVRLLKDWGFAQNIYWAMDTHTSGTYPVMDLMESKENIGARTLKVYTIIPIGSTMSTVYKVHEAFKRGVKKVILNHITKDNTIDGNMEFNYNQIVFCDNYVVVAVGDVYEGKKDNVAENYVSVGKNSSNIWHIVTIEPQNALDKKIRAKFCLSADAKWHDPQPKETKVDTNYLVRPLIHVDKTSTILNATFLTARPKKEIIYYDRFAHRENGSVMEKRIDLLAPQIDSGNNVYPFFRYGHIKRGDNHYQFYFDFKAIAHNCLSHNNNGKLSDEYKGKRKNEEKLSIKGWANQLAATIDKSAYNIVISPLSETNAEFCKVVLDNAFESNFHYIHVDVNDTDKEDFRTRYGYIADELKRINDANIDVRFFFIDESVCAGKTLERASKLIGMLCNQSGVSINELRAFQAGHPFDKVILLMNRSSYETAHQWVNDPIKEWVAYFDIAIPQYNMKNSSCPGCKVRGRYELLYKRSATNMLTKYFSDGVDKFAARTKEEYDFHLDEEIKAQKYLEWFKLYNDTICGEKDKLGDVIKYDEKKMRAIIAKEQFIRLKTMDRAYRELLYGNSRNRPTADNESDSINDIILGLLVEALTKKDPAVFDAESSGEYAFVDCFVSYLKVISRDYLAHIYDIRAAIYNILHCIFILLILPNSYNDLSDALEDLKKQTNEPMTLHYIGQIKAEVKKGKGNYNTIYKKIRNDDGNKIDRRLQYRIFKTIAHRLAMLHSNYIVKPEIMEMASKAYGRITKDNVDQNFLNEERIPKDYLASLKMASMSEDDDAMCNQLKNLSDNKGADSKGKEKN